MEIKRKLILYIAMSLDGYIAKPNDDLSFLSIVEKVGEDYGYKNFSDSIDTVILGRRTYDWVTANHQFPHEDKETYIITHTHRPAFGKTVFYTGNPAELVTNLKQRQGKHIFCDGGAEIVTLFLKENLFDELIISVIPIIVGSGIRLFKKGIPELRLNLNSVKNFDTGLVQLHYACGV